MKSKFEAERKDPAEKIAVINSFFQNVAVTIDKKVKKAKQPDRPTCSGEGHLLGTQHNAEFLELQGQHFSLELA